MGAICTSLVKSLAVLEVVQEVGFVSCAESGWSWDIHRAKQKGREYLYPRSSTTTPYYLFCDYSFH